MLIHEQHRAKRNKEMLIHVNQNGLFSGNKISMDEQ